jgi:hypothetical protein
MSATDEERIIAVAEAIDAAVSSPRWRVSFIP